jgi:hypothetical protein
MNQKWFVKFFTSAAKWQDKFLESLVPPVTIKVAVVGVCGLLTESCATFFMSRFY